MARRRSLLFESLSGRVLLAGDVAVQQCESDPQCAVAYHETFEPDDGGFVVDNSGGTINGFWHHSIGRRDDNLPGHSRDHAFYYGQFETILGGGRYPVYADHQGVISSPEVELSCGATQLSFSYLLDTRPPLDRDFIEVRVIDVETGITEVVLSRADGSLPETDGTWQTAVADLSAYAERKIQVQFSFDTGQVEPIDPEGWYIDDILITQATCSADLSVTKVVDDDTPNEGQFVEYTVTASNSVDSETTATQAVVTDALPSGVTFVSAATTEGNYDSATGIWSGLQLDPGESQTLTIQGIVDTGTAGQTITNIAGIVAAEDDPDTTNDRAEVALVVNLVDLSLTKTADDDTPNELQQVNFAIVVTNNQASNTTATGVIVRDILPAELSFDMAIVSQGEYDATTGTWTGIELPPGASATLALTATVAAGTAGQTLQNSVTVTGNETDPHPPGPVTETVTVNSVDLLTDKTVDDPTPSEGQTVEFTILVTNLSDSNAAATGVQIRDTLPAGLVFVAAPNGSFDESTRTVSWDIGIIPQDEIRSVSLTAVVGSDTAGQTLENVVIATGNETDPNEENNTDREIVIVDQFADLQVSKTVSNASPAVGDSVSFTITVTNAATSDVAATNVRVTDQFPAGLRVLSIGSGGTFDETTREVTWSALSIDVGASLELTIDALVQQAASGKILQNVAVATSDVPDPGGDNNTGAVTIAAGATVQFIAPLSVYRIDGPLPAAEVVADLTPSPGQATIAGHKWHDVNQNGIWDAGEVGRAGWQFFIDVDDNGLFDPQTETTVATDINGRYVFKDLDPGTYLIRETPTQSDGVFQIRSDVGPIAAAANEIVAGRFGITESPNVGVFDYSPFIRPADAFALRLGEPDVLSAMTPWQEFAVENTTGTEFNLTALDLSGLSDLEQEFVNVLRISETGLPTEIAFPISIAAGNKASFLVTYDPAIRDGDTVIQQYPDWLGDNRLTHPAHRFGASDQIVFVTDQGANFAVQLVGGSTYDSDISYDGRVELGDIEQFVTALDDPHDPTRDINTRCPNGAELVLASCAWPINGTPAREIGLGDFAPLNQELAETSARPPLIDLDPQNRSAAPGTDFFTEVIDSAARIAAHDASFANDRLQVIDSMTISITNPGSGDTLRVDADLVTAVPTFTFNGGLLSELGDVTTLTISGDGLQIDDYQQALRAISFETSGATGRVVVVSVQALGSVNPIAPFTRLLDDSELQSNLAIARIVVPLTVAAVGNAAATSAEGELVATKSVAATSARISEDVVSMNTTTDTLTTVNVASPKAWVTTTRVMQIDQGTDVLAESTVVDGNSPNESTSTPSQQTIGLLRSADDRTELIDQVLSDLDGFLF